MPDTIPLPERVEVVAYLFAMLVAAVPLAGLMGSAWEGGGLVPELLQLRYLLGLDLTALSVGALGFFLALLALMTADPKKRSQGLLLWASAAAAMVALGSKGVFLNPGADASDLLAAAPWLLAGALPGFLVGGGRRLLSSGPGEFRRASTGVFACIGALVAVSVLEYHLSYPLPFDVTRAGVEAVSDPGAFGIDTTNGLRHAAAAGVFLLAGRRFLRYDAGSEFLVLGPPNSGKSLLLAGTYLRARERSAADGRPPVEPSSDLAALVEELRAGSDWLVGATGHDVSDLSFRYVGGGPFPLNVTVSTLDYAGELLPRLANAIGAPTAADDGRLARLARSVRGADTLVLVLDAERFVNGADLGVEPHFDVLRAAPETDAVLAVTKSDHLAAAYRAEHGDPDADHEAFREYVVERLRNENERARALLDEADDTLPVRYRTREDESGERVPVGEGTPETAGFGRLLDRLGGR
jgi:hypothetical protein